MPHGRPLVETVAGGTLFGPVASSSTPWIQAFTRHLYVFLNLCHFFDIEGRLRSFASV